MLEIKQRSSQQIWSGYYFLQPPYMNIINTLGFQVYVVCE